MIGLTVFFALQEPVRKLDLTAETLDRSTAIVRSLPPGQGQYLHVNVFDGYTVWATPDGPKKAAAQVKVLVTTAHQKGYRVLGEWVCFLWKGAMKDPKTKGIMEHRAINAVRQRGEADVVSPFSAEVRDCLSSYADALGEQQAGLDALVVTYQLPRSPIFANGVESRARYVAATSLDPVDMVESPTLEQADLPNKTFSDYMTWRLKESNEFFGALLTRIRSKIPETELGVRADPEWASRNLFEKGSKLNDWIYQAVANPQIALLIDCDPLDPKEGLRTSNFLNSVRVLNLKTPIWIDTAGASPQISSFAERFTHQGLAVKVFTRQ